MGICVSSDAGRLESNRVAAELKAMHLEDNQITKLLLLGTGECGKSTILKQMQIISGTSFTVDELDHFRTVIRSNILESAQTLVRTVQGSLPWMLPNSQAHAVTLLAVSNDNVFASAELSTLVQHFWTQEREVMEQAIRRRPTGLLDSAVYFLDNAPRCLLPDYAPTEADVLRARIRTTGVNEYTLNFNKDQFLFIDVGGQRGERKKWIHAFSNVSALFFIASLSEYDQNLVEDPSRNRMAESLSLFEGIIHQRWFAQTPIILFLNKVDIFREKIATIDLGLFCPDYTDGCNADLALNWIRATFLSLSRLTDKQIFVHITNATDTNNVKFVWKAAREIVIRAVMDRNNLV